VRLRLGEGFGRVESANVDIDAVTLNWKVRVDLGAGKGGAKWATVDVDGTRGPFFRDEMGDGPGYLTWAGNKDDGDESASTERLGPKCGRN